MNPLESQSDGAEPVTSALSSSPLPTPPPASQPPDDRPESPGPVSSRGGGLRSWRTPSIQTPLMTSFALQVVAVVGLTGYLSLRSGQASVNEVATQLRQEIAARVEENLTHYLVKPHQINQINQDLVRAGWLNTQDLDAWVSHLERQIKIFPAVGAINLATAQKTFVGIGRNEAGKTVLNRSGPQTGFAYQQFALNDRGQPTTLIKSEANYDPTQRPYYRAAVAAGQPTWSAVFPHITDAMLVISAVEPIYQDQGNVLGVLQTRLNLSLVSDFLQSLQVGKTGRVFIIERSGDLIATSAAEDPLSYNQAHQVNRKPVTASRDPLVRATADYLLTHYPDLHQIQGRLQSSFKRQGQRQFIHVSPFTDSKGLDWLVVVVIPESDFMAQIHANTRITIGVMGLALLVSLGLGVFTTRWITHPLWQLERAAVALAAGKFTQPVTVKRRDELGVLAQAFNSMATQLQAAFAALTEANEVLEERVAHRTQALKNANQEIATLNEQLRHENSRLGTELDVARKLQEMILPREYELRAIMELEIVGYMKPAHEVGGDYYDIFVDANGQVKIGIGDVTGHGLESGVLMLMVQAAVRTLMVAEISDPIKVLNTLNQVIYQNIQRMNSDKNMTLALLNYQENCLSIFGQHEDLIVVRSQGDIERIDTVDLGFPIGLVDDISEFIAQRQVILNPGDVAVLYTDGITEAEGPEHQLYGLARLLDRLRAYHRASAREICEAVVQDVQAHMGDRPVLDDITLVVLKR